MEPKPTNDLFCEDLTAEAERALAMQYALDPARHKDASGRAAAIGELIANTYTISEDGPTVKLFCTAATKLIFFLDTPGTGHDQLLFDQTAIRFMTRHVANLPLQKAAKRADEEANWVINVQNQGLRAERAAWQYVPAHEKLWYLAALAAERLSTSPQ